MKTLIKTAIVSIGLVLLATVDVTVVEGPTGSAIDLQFMSEAEAVMGRQRRTRRRGLAVGFAAGSASGAAVASAATATAAPAPAPAPAPVAAPAPAAQPAGAPAIGTIVNTLPAGCVTTTKGGVQYFNCNNVFYRAAFQGSNLVYVVTQP
jgi:hypothetical protein